MTWKEEPIRHILEVKYNNGEGGLVPIGYAPGEFSKNLILKSLNCKELRVRPYTEENLQLDINEEYPDSVVDKLTVRIRDGTSVTHVGKFWTSNRGKLKLANGYNFEDDQPSIFYCSLDGPFDVWPHDQPPVLDKRLMQYFDGLKK